MLAPCKVSLAVIWFLRWHLHSEVVSVVAGTVIMLLFWKSQYYARVFLPLKHRLAAAAACCSLPLSAGT